MSPVGNVKEVNKIYRSFRNLDSKMVEKGFKLNSKRVNLIIIVNIICFCLFLFYMGSFEIYVLLIRYELFNFSYWIVSFLPSVVQSVALCFAICLLQSFYFRLKLARQILKNFQTCTSKKKDKYITAIPKAQKKFFNISKDSGEAGDQLEDIPCVFQMFNELLDLGCAIDNFFGPIFLSSIASIFAVTTVQIYYCYVLITSSQKSEHLGYSIWMIIVSINEIILNVLTIVYITTMCELITKQASWKIVVKIVSYDFCSSRRCSKFCCSKWESTDRVITPPSRFSRWRQLFNSTKLT